MTATSSESGWYGRRASRSGPFENTMFRDSLAIPHVDNRGYALGWVTDCRHAIRRPLRLRIRKLWPLGYALFLVAITAAVTWPIWSGR